MAAKPKVVCSTNMLYRLSLLILLVSIPSTTSEQLGKDALEQCVESDAFGVSKFEGDRGYIPDDRITATSWVNKREGSKGRLFHNSVWQPKSNNYNQHLQVDLGERKLITRVATQGYRGSGQFVVDYYISYSNDNTTFVAVINDLGEPEAFPGNTHDDKPQLNTFDYPVVARYVRFIPQRWNINIAMRVELYGCDYAGKPAYFDGLSWISFDAHQPNYLFTTIDVLRFRMKTNEDEGLVFYAAGNQGDYICLELSKGRLYVAINLGSLGWSDSSARGVAGSLLDDNQWHDVELIRQHKNVTISVDRVPVNITVDGEFERLDLDRYLYLGGVTTFYQPGITVRKNFIGCIENFVWNGIFMTRDKNEPPRFATHGNVRGDCPEGIAAKPMTLPDTGSHIKIKDAVDTPNSLMLKVDFRTYDNDRLLAWNPLDGDGDFFLRIGQSGYVEYEFKTGGSGVTVHEIAKSDNEHGSYADGLWHELEFTATANRIVLKIDEKYFITKRNLAFVPTKEFYIGGGNQEMLGFVGCIRRLYVQHQAQESVEIMCGDGGDDDIGPKCTGVQVDTCRMEDRCRPNPCEHSSQCTQTFDIFTCNCTDTGYDGATCHQSLHPNSCSRVFELNTLENGRIETYIDIDGAGALKPFPVVCFFNQETSMVETRLSHDSLHEVMVDGKQGPGSYSRIINYDANITQIDQLVHRASICEQQISYRCESSRLLQNPGSSSIPGGQEGSDDGTAPEYGQVYEAYGWWIGRNFQNNYYWGGSAPGTYKCACGLKGDCNEGEPRCNCDAGLPQQGVTDGGLLLHKEHLPVLELRFGDTGSLNDPKRGWHTLGPLTCSGDRFFDQPVTFRKTDSVIRFDTFWTRDSWELNTWDVSFRFKTTAENGVMVHRTGPTDFIEIKLVTSTAMSFRFNAGYGVQAVTVDRSFKLNDNEWHNVYAERNRKQSLLQVDEFSPEVIPHPLGVGYLPFQFNKPLTVGATADFKDGYVGCMSSLQLNGETLDLFDKVKNDPRYTYGLELGCVGKCDENPCMNGGLCKELYSQFICDCSYTPFRGLICGREVGVSVYDNQMLIYEPISELKTISENITIGFFTRKKGGVILQLTDDLESPNEYMVVELNNAGGIRVHFKFDNKRLQVNSQMGPGIEFANAQPHIIKFERIDGKIMKLQVDDYEPITERNLGALYPEGSDVYLENIKYILLGRNASSDTAFEGCIFRAQFDNHWPVKRIFQEPRPDFVSVRPNFDSEPDREDFDSVREERCGFEEILPPEEPLEARPTYEPPIIIDPTDPDDDLPSGESAALLGAVFGVVGIILIIVISVIAYKCRDVGAYTESEEDDLEMMDVNDGDGEDYAGVYHPRSSSEKYQTKSQPADQAFI